MVEPEYGEVDPVEEVVAEVNCRFEDNLSNDGHKDEFCIYYVEH